MMGGIMKVCPLDMSMWVYTCTIPAPRLTIPSSRRTSAEPGICSQRCLFVRHPIYPMETCVSQETGL